MATYVRDIIVGKRGRRTGTKGVLFELSTCLLVVQGLGGHCSGQGNQRKVTKRKRGEKTVAIQLSTDSCHAFCSSGSIR